MVIANKGSGKPLTMITAYDATFARIVDESGVDMILVGDSVGSVVQGVANTIPVTLEEMEYHVNAVLLNNNEVRDLRGIYDTLKDWVLFDIEKLQWLNLSYNYLVKIDEDICNFTNLKTL